MNIQLFLNKRKRANLITLFLPTITVYKIL
nr:MAG TPA: hypothetical protein [Caudoviricetes sp.]